MPKTTKAGAVMKAAAKAQSAQRRVSDCERALAKAQRARDRADRIYIELVSELLPDRQQPQEPRQEVHQSPAA